MRKYLRKCASTQVLAQVLAQVRNYASAQVRKCASAQVLKYASAQVHAQGVSVHVLAQVCKCASTQVHRYASVSEHVHKCANAQVCKYLRKFTSMQKCASAQLLAQVHAQVLAQIRKYEICAIEQVRNCTCMQVRKCLSKYMHKCLRNAVVTIHKGVFPGSSRAVFGLFLAVPSRTGPGGTPTGCRPFFLPHAGTRGQILKGSTQGTRPYLRYPGGSLWGSDSVCRGPRRSPVGALTMPERVPAGILE